MDYLALYITAKIMHLKPKNKMLTLSATVGALYSLIIIALGVDSRIGFVLSVAVSLLMTRAAYGKQKFLVFISNTLVFYAVNFALGGGITAVCNMLNIWQNKRGLMINGSLDTIYGDLPFGLLVLLASVCGSISLLSGKIIKNKHSKKECSLEIVINNQSVSTMALCDTGNLLKEPISGRPVIIVGFELIRPILPMEIWRVFKNNDLCISDPILQKAKIRFIPTSTVSGQGLMLAFAPDVASVNSKPTDAYVAIDMQNGQYGGYPALVPGILL